MTNNAMTKPIKPVNGKFDDVLEAWQNDKDTDWSELMTAWMEAPIAQQSPEMIAKLIKHFDSKWCRGATNIG